MSNSHESHLLIEKFVKVHKCHRNILDQACKYLDSLKLEIEKHSRDIKHEKISIKLEKEAVVKVEKADSTNDEAKLEFVKTKLDGELVEGANL